MTLTALRESAQLGSFHAPLAQSGANKRGATWPFEVVEWAETDEDAQIAQAPQRTDEEMNEALADGLFDTQVSPW
jgi:hypothetical protein